jgi:hypothetical protein
MGISLKCKFSRPLASFILMFCVGILLIILGIRDNLNANTLIGGGIFCIIIIPLVALILKIIARDRMSWKEILGIK